MKTYAKTSAPNEQTFPKDELELLQQMADQLKDVVNTNTNMELQLEELACFLNEKE